MTVWEFKPGSTPWRYSPNVEGHLPIDQGLGVTNSRYTPETKGGNARLVNQRGESIELWVYDIASDFAISGSVVQSKTKRQFLPHNFAQPSFTVKGQCATNQQYNDLSQFIRFTHLAAVNFSERKKLDFPTIVLILDPGGTDTIRNTKGAHEGMVLRGMVPSFGRGAKRFEFAKDYEFDFIVTRTILGLVTDDTYHERALKSFTEQITDATKKSLKQTGLTPFVDDPDLQKLIEDSDYQAGMGFGAAAYRKSADGGPD